MTSDGPVTLTVHSVFFFRDTGPGWAPPNPHHFHEEGMVFAGPGADGSADAFDVEVCTPSWLTEHFDQLAAPSSQSRTGPGPTQTPPVDDRVGRWWFGARRVLFGRGLILVRRWDREVIEQAIAEAFAAVTAPTWELAADRAGRLLPWEFDYRHDERIDQQYTNGADIHTD